MSGRSLVWLGHQPATIINWSEYKRYVSNKYGPQYASMQYNYARKYIELLTNPSKIETLSTSLKANVLKALVCLSKYLGIYLDFKDKLKQHGIKWSTTNSFDSFLRIFNNNHSDLLPWLKEASNILKNNESLYLRFMLLSGIRKSEGVQALNKIIKLHKQNILNEYYNDDLSVLEHFRYKQFLRHSKNVYITIIPKSFIMEIANNEPVSYVALHKRLRKRGIRTRIKELRQYYGSFMVRHELIREEVDLLQGRVPKSIFVRHYLTIGFKELRDRTLKAISLLEQSL